MTNLKNYGRVFYGIGIIGIGILHFFYKGFRQVIVPVTAESVANISFIVYLVAIYILVSGIFITIGKNVRNVSLLLGLVFFTFFLAGHLPVRLRIGGTWIDAIKIFALCGGAFVMASAFPKTKANRFFDKLDRFAFLGKYFFAVMLLLFGFGHFVRGPKISELVPGYIPWALFWTYVAGIALFGSGLSFMSNFKVKQVGILLGITLFLWLILLHIYYVVRFPQFQDGENIIASFECLAFCGIALAISQLPAKRSSVSGKNKMKRTTSIQPAA